MGSLDPLKGQTIESVEVFTDEKTGKTDTLVLNLLDGRRFSIEAEGGYLTIGEET